eukprot:7379396-Prymnesium_polylepis.1
MAAEVDERIADLTSRLEDVTIAREEAELRARELSVANSALRTAASAAPPPAVGDSDRADWARKHWALVRTSVQAQLIKVRTMKSLKGVLELATKEKQHASERMALFKALAGLSLAAAVVASIWALFFNDVYVTVLMPPQLPPTTPPPPLLPPPPPSSPPPTVPPPSPLAPPPSPPPRACSDTCGPSELHALPCLVLLEE